MRQRPNGFGRKQNDGWLLVGRHRRRFEFQDDEQLFVSCLFIIIFSIAPEDKKQRLPVAQRES